MGKIDIRELSIGDWVCVQFPEGDKWNERVLYLSNTGRLEVQYKNEKVVRCTIDFIHPIPLTPEILEKNGLCVVEEDADFSEYELFGSENFSIFHIKGTLHYRLETPQASLVCWNVHQLQRALRLACVEKDIVL